jgi:hypothetical protein
VLLGAGRAPPACPARTRPAKNAEERVRDREKRIVHILLVEYHAAFQQSASHLMDREADLEVVAQVGSVREGREKTAEGA